MKRHFCIRYVVCLGLATMIYPSHAQQPFRNLPNATDSTYGYSGMNPIRLRKGNTEKSILQQMNYLSGLTTADRQRLVLLSHSSVADPGSKEPFINVNDRFSKSPANASTRVLDKYVFLTADTKDTITLFIDIYNKGEVMLPVGLKYEAP
jgi:hypothetical protein